MIPIDCCSDLNYRGDYDNADESRGFNYHQGPEWLWLTGYYLRARLAIGWRLRGEGGEEEWREAVHECRRTMAAHFVHLHRSPWRSLPELTNKVWRSLHW